MKRRSIYSATELDTVALLAALCLFLSTVEYLIPKPIPFMRLGLANLPILVSLEFLSPPMVLLLVLLKIVGQGLVNGTLFSYVFLFSAAGSTVSGLLMLLVSRVPRRRLSLVGVSVVGALGSNIVQIVLARFIIFGEGAWLIGPPFIAIGTASAILLGIFAEKFGSSSRWIERVRPSHRR